MAANDSTEQLVPLKPKSLILMDSDDIRTLVEVNKHRGHDIDTPLLLHTLYKKGYISVDQYSYMKHQLEKTSRVRRFPWFIYHIRLYASLQDLVDVFYILDLACVATAILEQRRLSPLQTLSTGKYRHTNTLANNYLTLARKIGNQDTSVSIHVDFQTLTDTLKANIFEHKCPTTRQNYLDALSVLVAVRVFIYNDISKRSAILSEMMTLGNTHKDTLDITTLRVIYLISKCYLERKKGDLDTAEHFLSQAHQLCYSHGNSLLKYLAYTAQYALYRTRYVATMEEEYKTKSLMACENAIHVLADHPTDFQCYVRRFLQICKALTLLHFGQELAVDSQHCNTSISDLTCAKVILDTLESDYDNLDNKQKMYFRACKAKLHWKDKPRLAIGNVDMACDVSSDAYVSETERANLNKLAEDIKRQIND